jgi:NAD(P) transhydrogenase
VHAFVHQANELGVTLRLGEAVADSRCSASAWSWCWSARIADLAGVGRRQAHRPTALDRAGITPRRGRIPVNAHYQTAVPHIYARAISSARPVMSTDGAGRLAACHAFGVEATSTPELFLPGIYAIPETRGSVQRRRI